LRSWRHAETIDNGGGRVILAPVVPAAGVFAWAFWDRWMSDWLRGVLRLDAVVPVILIAAALLMTLEPTILGVTVTERQIVLAFFGFLGHRYAR
jgi:hypothetical protein